MGVGPKDIRIIRTDSLVDMGIPAANDKVLIRDATDGLLKIADVSDVGITDHGALTGLGDFTADHGSSHDAHDHSTALGTATTTDLAEGTNLYYTTARVNSDIDTRVTKSFVDALNVDADTLDGVDSTGFATSGHTHPAGDIVSGQFADARISQSSVTQHQAALTITQSQISDLDHYTSTDFNTDFAAKSTTDLSEGTNLYYTDARVNADIDARVTKSFVDALNVDADTLDGIDSTGFVELYDYNIHRIMTSGSTYSSVDFDTLNIVGEFRFINPTGTTNGPSGYGNHGYYFGFGGGDVASRGAQMLVDANGGMFFRTLDSGTWRTVWNDSNDGPSSGLNADLLDGEHASAFADAVHTHAASDVTTGTFADARISQSSVTQHQAALTITESQISDLDHYTTTDFTTDHNAISGSHVTNGNSHDHNGGDGGTIATSSLSGHTAAAHNSLSLDHGSLAGLGDVADHPGYSTTDGSRAYTGAVSGVSPTASAHLATKGYVDDRMPTGSITMYGSASAPTGWLLADGSAVSRTTYSDLFGVIGTTYGTGDGSTTFNLPDFDARFPVGADGGVTYSNGSTGGAASVTLTEAQMPSHTHTGPSHTHTGPSHTHSGPSHTHSIDPPNTGTTSDAPSAMHIDGSNSAWQSGQSLTYVHWGRDDTGRSSNVSGLIGGGAHTHTVNISAFTSGGGGTGATGAAGTGNTGSAGTGATGSAGSGSSHENRPPYLGVTFIIKT